ncbi:histidine-phosphotransfer domain, HPT domain-containing protein [Backusella circina FSU 941]|nr:histidine-phosphotransfer domain, HPT domain-containing protein [Backusella circina FSU 941]
MNVTDTLPYRFNKQQQSLPQYTTQEQNLTSTIEDILDASIFEQLLAMDDDNNPEFSYSIILEYFEQAINAFQDMNNAFARNDLSELARIGHFLKGSSAAIGLRQIKICCEEIQNLNKLPDHVEAFQKATPLLLKLKYHYSVAEGLLKEFYNCHCLSPPLPFPLCLFSHLTNIQIQIKREYLSVFPWKVAFILYN